MKWINRLQAITLALLIMLVVCANSAFQTTGYSVTIMFGHEQELMTGRMIMASALPITYHATRRVK